MFSVAAELEDEEDDIDEEGQQYLEQLGKAVSKTLFIHAFCFTDETFFPVSIRKHGHYP